MKRNFLNSVAHKLRFGLKVIKIYKTWVLGFADYFKLLGRRKIIHQLRNGLKYQIRTETNDFGIINEVYIKYKIILKGLSPKGCR